jgi:hypothetical protein
MFLYSIRYDFIYKTHILDLIYLKQQLRYHYFYTKNILTPPILPKIKMQFLLNIVRHRVVWCFEFDSSQSNL